MIGSTGEWKFAIAIVLAQAQSSAHASPDGQTFQVVSAGKSDTFA